MEIVINTWMKDRRIPSFEEVSKVENAALLNFFNGKLPSSCLSDDLVDWNGS